MKATPIHLLLFAVFLLIPACGPDQELAAPETDQPQETAPDEIEPPATEPDLDADAGMDLAAGNTAFAIDLHQRLAQAGENLFVSPFSISSALAMTYAGARGDTARQMEEVLRLGDSGAHEAFAELLANLREREGEDTYELVVANALWGQDGYEFRPEFLDLLETKYDSAFRPVDFASDPDAVAEMINEWVEEQTQDKIQDLVPPGTLDPLTRLVLANAIYFKAAWMNAFEEEATATEAFTRHDGDTVDADMMRQTEQFLHAEFDGLQVLELPYEGRDLSMIIALPESHDGLPAVEDQFSPEQLDEWLDALEMRQVNLKLPRFEFTTEVTLNDYLQAMGMRDAFLPPEADFTGMTPEPGELYISDVLHKAFIDVHEEGTEAAAATAVVMRTTAMPVDEPVEFYADRPFLFLIRDMQTGSILFMGRVADPSV